MLLLITCVAFGAVVAAYAYDSGQERGYEDGYRDGHEDGYELGRRSFDVYPTCGVCGRAAVPTPPEDDPG